MTRTFGLRSGVVVAVFALGLAGSPVVAHASPFANFRSAAADQYQSSSGSGGGANANSGSGANGNSASSAGNGSGAKRHKVKSSRHHHSSGVNGQSASGNGNRSSGANLGVAPSTHPIKTKGTLPFTGLDLTMLVLVALGLLAGGLSLRAVERLKSRRRVNAST